MAANDETIASAESITQPLTLPETRQRLIHALPARAQVAEGDALANRAVAQLTILLKSNLKLRECDPISIYSCLIAAFGLNLEVNTPLQHCFLVPFAKECKLVMGYRGLIALARRGGAVKAITAEVVYEGDEFYYGLGTENLIRHVPAVRTGEEKLIAAYSVATYDPHNHQFVVMQRPDIDKVRGASASSENAGSPWVKWFSEMARKCPVKRVCKLLPQDTDDLARALEHDDRYEIGKAQDIPRVPLPAGTDLLANGTPRSEATVAEKMRDGAARQTVTQEETLRREIRGLVFKLPKATTTKILLELGLNIDLDGNIDALVSAADRLEAALKASPAEPPAADDEIPY